LPNPQHPVPKTQQKTIFMKYIALIISVILHPLIIPLLSVFIIFEATGFTQMIPVNVQLILYGLVFVITCVIPLLLMPLLKAFDIISSYHMEDHRERIVPMFIIFIAYFLAYLAYRRVPIDLPQVVFLFFLISDFAVIFAMLITYWWKISTHLIGMGGLVGVILFLSMRYMLNFQLLLMVAFLATGLLAFSRLRLNAHTPEQVYAGFFVGLITTLVGMSLLWL